MFNKDEFKGNWKQFKGEIKKAWGKLTDDDLTQAEGNYDILVGKLQERYGRAKDAVERELQESYSKWNTTRTQQRKAGT